MTAKIVDLIESKTIQLEEYRESIDKKSSKKAQLLESGIESLRAYDRIQIADRVTHLTQDYGIGVVTDKAFSQGDMPLVWVNWNNSTVPTPEQPNLLVVVSNGQDSTNTQDNEIIELQQLESVIYSSMKADFKNSISRGEALLTIREKKLYKLSGYSTFDQYCKDKHGFTKNYANRQIRAATIFKNLKCDALGHQYSNDAPGHQNQILPITERQLREVGRLPREKQFLAWSELTADGQQPTATQTARIVEKYLFDLELKKITNETESKYVWHVGQKIVLQIKNKTDKELNKFNGQCGAIKEITELGLIVVEAWQTNSEPVTLPPVRPDELIEAPNELTFDGVNLPQDLVEEWITEYGSIQSGLNNLIRRYRHSPSAPGEFKEIVTLIKKKKNEQQRWL